MTLDVNVTLPNSFAKTLFSYYLIIRLIRGRETLDTKDVHITGATCSTTFDLEEEDLKKINAYKLEVELYQWRLKVFDSLLEEGEISLVSLKNSSTMKRSLTWNEERYTFECSILNKSSDQKDSVIKVIKILDIPEPYKIKDKNKDSVVKVKEYKKPKVEAEEEEEEKHVKPAPPKVENVGLVFVNCV